MNTKEAVQILRGMAECLRSQPNQFTFQIRVTATGAQGFASAPGATSISGVAIGGGTGFRASVSITDADISIANSRAEQAFVDLIHSAAAIIDEVAGEVDRVEPDPGKVEQLISGLAKLAIPAILVEVTRTIVHQAMEGMSGL